MTVLLARSTLAVALLALGLGLAWAAPAADDKPAGKVEVGQPAPDIELPATSIGSALPEKKDAQTLHLKDFQGKKNVVLWFFPKAMTRG